MKTCVICGKYVMVGQPYQEYKNKEGIKIAHLACTIKLSESETKCEENTNNIPTEMHFSIK